ncbi:tyrosine-type recombinase/integrase [Paenibacillus sp. 8b26]|uniref:tyrosine-type recombinase/integrase n=1 Tax=Paenibacillus sp. 8b26 TaxID=3424133 RepID=UPI003D648D01
MFSEITFQIENFMLYCTSRNLAKRTLASYEQTLKLFAVYLEREHQTTDFKEVGSGHIRMYVKYVQDRGKYSVVSREESRNSNHPELRGDYNKPVSATTIANYVRNIKVFFNWFHTIEREIQKNPVGQIALPKVERKQKHTLSESEIVLILRQFDTTKFHGYRNWMIFRLLLDTGMRINECVNLEPKHIDFNKRAILIVKPKNKQQRFVYFSSKLSVELKSWLKHRDRYKESQWLFPTTKGTQLDVRNYEYALRQAGKAIGLNVHPHQLRNNYAKYYILAGGDWFTLSRILGHASVETTQKAYLDFTDDEVRGKAQLHSPLNTLKI